MVVRAVAVKTRVRALLQGEFFSGGTIDNPSFLKVGETRLSRVNVVGRVVEKFENPDKTFSSVTVRDATGDIKVKFFAEDIGCASTVSENDFVMVVGKVRERIDGTRKERFVLGEVLKKLDNALEQEKLRVIELGESGSGLPTDKSAITVLQAQALFAPAGVLAGKPEDVIVRIQEELKQSRPVAAKTDVIVNQSPKKTQPKLSFFVEDAGSL